MPVCHRDRSHKAADLASHSCSHIPFTFLTQMGTSLRSIGGRRREAHLVLSIFPALLEACVHAAACSMQLLQPCSTKADCPLTTASSITVCLLQNISSQDGLVPLQTLSQTLC